MYIFLSNNVHEHILYRCESSRRKISVNVYKKNKQTRIFIVDFYSCKINNASERELQQRDR